MYMYDRISPNINIRLPNGLYIFVPESASGKTRLAKLFDILLARNEPVVCYSYHDFVKGIEVGQIVKKRKYEVVLLDRFDMYHDISMSWTEEYQKNAIILLDTKVYWPDDYTDFCTITLKEGEVLVR